MVLLRKLRTLRQVIRHTRNWPELLADRVGLPSRTKVVRLRNGIQLQVSESIHNSWGQFFEAAIADVYGIRDARPDLIVDVGANIGSFTCLAARTHPSARVYAFEPQPEIAALLQNNLQVNRLNNVELITAPVTRDGRTVRFWSHVADGSSGIYLAGDNAASELQSVTLDCIPFQQFQSAFIKLDCEGAEGEIIEWLCDKDDALPPTTRLACEYHPWTSPAINDSASLLTKAGWRVTTVEQYAEPYLFALRSETSADHSR